MLRIAAGCDSEQAVWGWEAMGSGFDKASLVWEADGAVSDAAALDCRAPGMGVLASVSCGSEERAEFREAV